MFSILLSSASEFLQNAAPGEHDLSDMATIKIINVCSVSSLRISVNCSAHIGRARRKGRNSQYCPETTRSNLCAATVKRKLRQLFALNVSMMEPVCCATIAGKTMNVAKKCFQRFITHPALASVDMKEATSTRIKHNDYTAHRRIRRPD